MTATSAVLAACCKGGYKVDQSLLLPVVTSSKGKIQGSAGR